MPRARASGRRSRVPGAAVLRRAALAVALGLRPAGPGGGSLVPAALRGHGGAAWPRRRGATAAGAAAPRAAPAHAPWRTGGGPAPRPARRRPEVVQLPRHRSNAQVNSILERAEELVDGIERGELDPALRPLSSRGLLRTQGKVIGLEDRVYANSYVNLDSTEVVGFDYDYTLVSYKPALLHLLYEKAREVLVEKFFYPVELRQDLSGYDPEFPIRGLAVDLETGWICKLTYRHRVATAFFGRERVDSDTVRDAYKSSKGTGVLPPDGRKARLRPLNDLFSLVEACLLADVVQWFKDRSIPFEAKSVVTDVLSAVGKTHTSGTMHRAVVEDLERFIEPDAKRHMRQLLEQLRAAGKQIMLVSNSEFWYVDAGMRHTVGEDWRDLFNVVIVSAGKPAFYTQARPFREVSARTGRVKFKPVTSMEPGEVYCQGSIEELMRLNNWTHSSDDSSSSGIIYFGDSLFADLVEARRLYGWTTGAIIREVRDELHVQSSGAWRRARHTVQVLLHTAQLCQEEMGPDPTAGPSNRQHPHTPHDREVLDALEKLVTRWRRRQDVEMNGNFGSIFRASPREGVRSTPSLFALCLQRHVDIYTSRVENLRLYSTDHRFYPSEARVGIPHESMHTTDSILELICDVQASDMGDPPDFCELVCDE